MASGTWDANFGHFGFQEEALEQTQEFFSLLQDLAPYRYSAVPPYLQALIVAKNILLMTQL